MSHVLPLLFNNMFAKIHSINVKKGKVVKIFEHLWISAKYLIFDAALLPGTNYVNAVRTNRTLLLIILIDGDFAILVAR